MRRGRKKINKRSERNAKFKHKNDERLRKFKWRLSIAAPMSCSLDWQFFERCPRVELGVLIQNENHFLTFLFIVDSIDIVRKRKEKSGRGGIFFLWWNFTAQWAAENSENLQLIRCFPHFVDFALTRFTRDTFQCIQESTKCRWWRRKFDEKNISTVWRKNHVKSEIYTREGNFCICESCVEWKMKRGKTVAVVGWISLSHTYRTAQRRAQERKVSFPAKWKFLFVIGIQCLRECRWVVNGFWEKMRNFQFCF